jgi:hypothetical protein
VRELQPAIRIRLQRQGKEKALQIVTLVGGKEARLCLALHTFGHHAQSEIVGQVDDGERDGGVVRVVVMLLMKLRAILSESSGNCFR